MAYTRCTGNSLTFIDQLTHCIEVGLELRAAAPHERVHDWRPVSPQAALDQEVTHSLYERMRLFLQLNISYESRRLRTVD